MITAPDFRDLQITDFHEVSLVLPIFRLEDSHESSSYIFEWMEDVGMSTRYGSASIGYEHHRSGFVWRCGLKSAADAMYFRLRFG